MEPSESQLYEFGEFRLDTEERLLLRGGQPVPLAPKVFDTLVLLVRNNGHLVDKEALMRALWPDTFVEDVNLSVNISALRKVLGESEAGQKYISTVPKKGYRFTAEIRRLENEAADLVVHNRIKARIVTEEVTDVRSEDLGTVNENGEKLQSVGWQERKSSRTSALLRRRALWFALVVGCVLMASGLGLYTLLGRKPQLPFQKINIARLTNTGTAVEAAISPDGKYVVYAMDESGKGSLWLREIVESNKVQSNLQVVPPVDGSFGAIEFSNDGSFLYYIKVEEGVDTLFRMPVLGGAPSRLVVDIDSPVAQAPDGGRLAFVRGYPAQGEYTVMIANADGSGERKLAIRKAPDFFSAADSGPAWSPDGSVIACPGGTRGSDGAYMSVLEVRTADGAVRPLTTQRWWQIGHMVWFPDGKGLVFTGKEQESTPSQLWYLSYPGGELRKITNDVNEYHSVSLTANGTALVTVQSALLSKMWVANSGDTEHAVEVRSNNADGLGGLAWTPQHKIVYVSQANGRSDIWIMDQDGSHQTQLTDGGSNFWPRVTTDGRYIVFSSDRAGARTIWRMNMDGKNLLQLTRGGSEWVPDCSPDGRWVFYRSGGGKQNLFRISIDGGEPEAINNIASSQPNISPDGQWIAGAYFGDKLKTAIYPIAGGEPVKLFNFLGFNIRWTPDGRGLTYIEPSAHRNLLSQPLEGGPPKQLTNFKTDTVFRFAWSPDGKQLAMTRGTVTYDVVLLNNLK